MTLDFWSPIPPWQRLANAIVEQAAHDYRVALKGLRVDPESHSANDKANVLELFFRSEYMHVLTKLDGEFLIEQLRKEEKPKHSRSESIKVNPRENYSIGGRP